MPDRDPGVDPKVGDVVGFRDKPARTVVNRFFDAAGEEWVDYVVTKQIQLRRWKRAMSNARVYHAST